MATKHDVDGIGDALEDLFAVLLERKNSMQDESYVSLLYKKGEDSILKKVGEESAEVIIASKGGDREHLIHELVDLWFHCLVLMGHKDLKLEDLAEEFRRRMGTSGVAEKASRKDH
jgi:phosphoribosyl-ATP pyrophosphohydrolase